MKNFFHLVIILIIVSTKCSSTEEKPKKDESTFIVNSLINSVNNFFSNYLASTVKYVSCPLGNKGCEVAANIQIAAEGLKTAGIGQKEAAKILKEVIKVSTTEVSKEVAEKVGETVVTKAVEKTSTEVIKEVAEKVSETALTKAVEKTSTEAIKGVAEKKAEKLVFEWGTKTSLFLSKIIPVVSSGHSIYNAVKKYQANDNWGAFLYSAEAVVCWIPGISYFSLIPSAVNTIKEISEIQRDK